MTKILIADDHLIIRQGLRLILETEDDLGNRGLAPYGTVSSGRNGFMSVRQIEIRK